MATLVKTMVGIYNILLLCIWLQNASSIAAEEVFDRILFVQSWAKSLCLTEGHDGMLINSCDSSPPDAPGKRNSWSIHSIRPWKMGVKGDRGPQFCKKNGSGGLIEQEVESIVPDLNMFWLWPRHGDWLRDWKKYGTCAASLDSLNTQRKYLSQGLTWLSQYNMYDVLQDSNIMPSDDRTYKIEKINEAIYDKLHVKPIIICYKKNGNDFLDDIRLCFDISLQLVDCDGVYKKERGLMSNCKRDVYYYDIGIAP